MKYFIIGFIKVYQMIPGNWHNYCKHIPTCSNYAIEAIIKHGTIKGTLLSFKRILRCNPFNKTIYDPVKERNEK